MFEFFKTLVTTTSREAYRDIHKTFKAKTHQMVIMDIFNGDTSRYLSAKEISRETGIEINSVTGRVNELMELGKLDSFGTKTCSVTRRRVRALGICDPGGDY